MRKQYHFWPGRHGVDAWDVDRLIALTADLPVEQVAVADVAELDTVHWFDDWHRPTVRNVVEHCLLLQSADLAYPIILGPDGRVMDGMHRVAKAYVEGRDAITAVQLAAEPAPDFVGVDEAALPYDDAP